MRIWRWVATGLAAYFGANLLQVVLGSYRDCTGPADCAIVLGAAVWPGERPSPTLRARAEHAGDVYHAGHVGHVVLTGGVGHHPPSEAEVMRRVLCARGIPEDAVVLEEQATTTAESARHCAEILRRRGWRTALLVSDPWHLPRAARLFRREGIAALPSPAFNTPTWTRLHRRLYYTFREAAGLSVQRILCRRRA